MLKVLKVKVKETCLRVLHYHIYMYFNTALLYRFCHSKSVFVILPLRILVCISLLFIDCLHLYHKFLFLKMYYEYP